MRFGKEGKLYLLIFGLFTLLSLLLFWPIFLGKVNLNASLLVSFYPFFGQNLPYKNIIGLDQLRLYFPNYSLVFDQLRHFEVPLWNPYIFAGNLNVASLQSAVFYPLNVFGLFVPLVQFWHLMRITPMILGAFFMFLYLSNLKLSKIPSFFGALAFGFSPFILSWGEEQIITPHSVIWLPLILLCIDKVGGFNLTKNPRLRKLALLTISLSVAFSVFAGFVQTTIYVLAIGLFYAIFRFWSGERKVKDLAVILGAFAVGILICAIQLIPTAELYFSSARSVAASRGIMYGFLLPPRSILTYLAPDFFGNPASWNFFGSATYYESMMFVGTPALIFALYEIWEGRRERLSKFYFVLGFFALVLTLDSPIARIFLLLPVPVLSTSIANRLLFITTFCLAVLAAMGMERWIRAKDQKIFKYIFAILVFYLAVFAYLLGVRYFGFPYFISGAMGQEVTYKISLRNLVLPIFAFWASTILLSINFFTRKENLKTVAALVLVAVLYFQLFVFASKYFNFSDSSNVFPDNAVLSYIQKNQGYFRSWGVGSAYLENNFATKYRIFFPEGYDSLNILSYAQFTQAMQNGIFGDVSFRADAGVGRGDTDKLLANTNRRKLIDLVGVKYVFVQRKDFDVISKNNFKKVFEDGNLGVFENKEVVPRVFLASNYEGPPEIDSTNKTTDQINFERRRLIPQKLLSSDFDYRNVLILEKPSPVSAQYGDGTAEIVSYKPQEVIVKTESSQPKLLFLSDNYYPGWRATVDGNEVEILRADYTFRAVPLVPGQHIVRFYFDSLSFKLGLLISLGSLIITLGFLFWGGGSVLAKVYPKVK